MDRTYGRREAVDRRGVQPLEPRERCASLTRPSASLEVEKERETGEMERKRKQHIAHRAAPTHQRSSSNSNSNSSSNSSSNAAAPVTLLLKKQRTTS